MSAVWFALASALCFSTASVVYAHYAKRVSALWVNAFKAGAATLGFGVTYLFVHDFSQPPKMESLVLLFVSGLIGLNIGDLFLLNGFARIGSARSLIIFSFQPVILGFFGYLIFQQPISFRKASAIFLMIACVLTMSYEKFKREGRWEWKGPLYAFAGVLLDSVGILLTRYAFDSDDRLDMVGGNFYRCIGAAFGFFLMSRYVSLRLFSNWLQFSPSRRTMILIAAFLGTYISLMFFLTAITRGHLATVSAVVVTGPVFAALIECAVEKKWPSRYLLFALSLFAIGFGILQF